MSEISDLTIPYSALAYGGEDQAVLKVAATDHEVLSALLMQVVRRHATHLAEGAPVTPVSVTIDVTGSVETSDAIAFSSSVDRKTRTLIFIGGEAMQGSAPLLKATAVYRIG